MARIESSILIPDPIEDTFSFLDQSESHRRFIPRCMEFNQTSTGTFGKIGTTIAGTLNYFGIRIPVDYEIIEYEPVRKLAMKGQMGPVAFKDGYVLSPAENATRITFWLELSMSGFAEFLQPFAGWIGRVHAWETLRNLKREISR